jgi:nucleoside 2-deoxyribosyltransferase
MKIYFAGAIRGGRDDVALYGEIISMLKSYGTVLTEHLGDTSITGTGQMGQGKSAEDIYSDDVAWLDESDIVIAEVTTPSLGVGYELGRAEAKGKRIVCLFRINAGRHLSGMVLGNPNVKVFEYEKVEDLGSVFKEVFEGL